VTNRFKTAKAFLDCCRLQGKSNIAFKGIPVESKQSFQIGILKKLAVCFVAFLIPPSVLAGLFARLASQLNTTGSDDRLLRYSTRKASTWHTSLRRPPANHTHDIFVYHSFPSRISGPDRSTLAICLAIVEISVGPFVLVMLAKLLY
jgi:hypothetical protein